MNKLISNINGGYPFVLDDLRFQDSAYREAFKGIFDHYEQINGTDGIMFHQKSEYLFGSNFPESFCFYRGEIYRIPETPLSSTGSPVTVYRIKFSTNTYQTGGAGTKVFQDGQTHETFQLRTAYLEKTNSANVGDFIALNYGTGTKWNANQTHDFKGIMKRYVGIPDIQSDITTLDTAVGQNTTDIQTNETDIQLMNNAWKYMSQSELNQRVRFVETSAGTGGTEVPVAWAGIGSSHVKYKRLNDNTGVVDFFINNITCPSHDDVGTIASLRIYISELVDGAFLQNPTKFKSFYTTCEVRCLSHQGVVSGTGQLTAHSGGQYIVVRAQNPNGQSSYVALNRQYTIGSYGETTVSSGTSFEPRFMIYGQAVVEWYK